MFTLKIFGLSFLAIIGLLLLLLCPVIGVIALILLVILAGSVVSNHQGETERNRIEEQSKATEAEYKRLTPPAILSAQDEVAKLKKSHARLLREVTITAYYHISLVSQKRYHFEAAERLRNALEQGTPQDVVEAQGHLDFCNAEESRWDASYQKVGRELKDAQARLDKAWDSALEGVEPDLP